MNISSSSTCVNPFYHRPWIANNCAAMPAQCRVGVKGALVGFVVGGVEIRLLYPTEYIKTRLQLDEMGEKKRYKGIIDCYKQTIEKKGFFGLYRGLSVLVWGNSPTFGVRFGTFELVRSYFVDSEGKLSIIGKFFPGLTAGLFEAILVVTPIENIKVKLINDHKKDNPKFRGYFLNTASITFRDEGFTGLYRGLVPTMIKQASNQAIRFSVMEMLKNKYTNNDRSKHIPILVDGAMGFVAGGCSVLCNTPVDVVKTRMQSQEAKKYTSSLDCAFHIWQREGPIGLYKGVASRLFRVCPEVAITFMLYDYLIKFYNALCEGAR